MTDSANPATSGQPPPNVQIATLESDVALANRAFSESLRDASEAGRQAVGRARGAIRPVLIGAAVLGGAVLLLQLVRGTRVRRSVRAVSPVSRRPFWPNLARSAASAVAMAGARRLALMLLERQRQGPERRLDVARDP